MCCYVYFIKAADCLKIGHAVNVEDRLNQIQTGNPYKCEIIRKIECEDKQAAKQLEDYLHAKYCEYQTEAKNEWFVISLLKILAEKTDIELKNASLTENIVLPKSRKKKPTNNIDTRLKDQYWIANNNSKRIKKRSFQDTVELLYRGLLEEYRHEEIIEKYIKGFQHVDYNYDIDSFAFVYPYGCRHAYKKWQCKTCVDLFEKFLKKELSIESFTIDLIEFSLKQFIDTIRCDNSMFHHNCCKTSDFYSRYIKQYQNVEEYLLTGHYLLPDGVFDFIHHIYEEIKTDGMYLTVDSSCKNVSDFNLYFYNINNEYRISLIENNEMLFTTLKNVFKQQIRTMVSLDYKRKNSWYLF